MARRAAPVRRGPGDVAVTRDPTHRGRGHACRAVPGGSARRRVGACRGWLVHAVGITNRAGCRMRPTSWAYP